MRIRWVVPGVLFASVWSLLGAAPRRPDVATLSIVATTDLHGRIESEHGRGGLAMLGGFLRHLRAERAADGGAVLLLDAGDTFQGGLASNLSEGGVVIDAYNALGYTALAVGNHDFEFGARDADGTEPAGADPRGALKAAAARARFPFLAANLVDEANGLAVNWPNVSPSTLVRAADVAVGLIGVMTADALTKTLAANVGGLRTTPLVPAILTQARALRARGARLVVVVAHAGGRCTDHSSPTDLASCDPDAEIFAVARQLPPGLVDVIVAGHTHGQVSHVVGGIPIIQAGSLGHAFARVDLDVDRRSGAVIGQRIAAPRPVCTWEAASPGACLASGGSRPRYEGRTVEPDPAIAAAMAPALEEVRALRSRALGVVAHSALTRDTHPESALANAFADAMRESLRGVQAAISYGAGMGGLRADLAPGPVSFGMLYDVFPFDNRVIRVALGRADLEALLTEQIRRRRGRLTGVSGLRATVQCAAGGPVVSIESPDGAALDARTPLLVAVPEYSASRLPWNGRRAAPGSRDTSADAPLLRHLVSSWMQARQRPLRASEFLDPARPRWHFVGRAPACEGQT
jgi:5'-nucleotidase